MNEVIGTRTITKEVKYIKGVTVPLGSSYKVCIHRGQLDDKVLLEFFYNLSAESTMSASSLRLSADECERLGSWLYDMADVLREEEDQ